MATFDDLTITPEGRIATHGLMRALRIPMAYRARLCDMMVPRIAPLEDIHSISLYELSEMMLMAQAIGFYDARDILDAIEALRAPLDHYDGLTVVIEPTPGRLALAPPSAFRSRPLMRLRKSPRHLACIARIMMNDKDAIIGADGTYYMGPAITADFLRAIDALPGLGDAPRRPRAEPNSSYIKDVTIHYALDPPSHVPSHMTDVQRLHLYPALRNMWITVRPKNITIESWWEPDGPTSHPWPPTTSTPPKVVRIDGAVGNNVLPDHVEEVIVSSAAPVELDDIYDAICPHAGDKSFIIGGRGLRKITYLAPRGRELIIGKAPRLEKPHRVWLAMKA